MMRNLSREPDIPQSAQEYYRRRVDLTANFLRDYGYNFNQMLDDYHLERRYRKVHTASEAIVHSRKFRESGLHNGLVLGHYRAISEGNLAIISLGLTFSSELMVGIEPGTRTEEYKGVRTFLTDGERASTYAHAMPNIYWFWIDKKLPYTNEGYRSLVTKISPNRYFADSELPEETLAEMRSRVETVGGEFVRLFSERDETTSALERRGVW